MTQILLYNEAKDKMVPIQAQKSEETYVFTGLEQANEIGLDISPDELCRKLAGLVAPDTFTFAADPNGEFKSMTYGEWEALRCRQANSGIRAKVDALDLDATVKSEIISFFDSFTEDMNIKYLQGKRSWQQLYDELFDELFKLADWH